MLWKVGTMGVGFPSIACVKQVHRQSRWMSNQGTLKTEDVPMDYFTVYIGEGWQKGFSIPLSYLFGATFVSRITKLGDVWDKGMK